MTATFDDVILQSQPAFYDGGAEGYGTAGMTWWWVLESPAGGDADWTDVDFECEILSQGDNDLVILEFDMTADEANRLTLRASADVTATLDRPNVETYHWRARAVKGSDKVAMWTAAASTFVVYPSGYVEGS